MPPETPNTLHLIIAEEKAIQASLKDEEHRAAAWLKQKKTELEKSYTDDLRRLEAERQESIKQAEAMAHARAEETIARAREIARRLEALGPDALQPFIERHLSQILPGSCHDRPDVED